MRKFMSAYLANIIVVMKLAALVTAVVLATSIAEFLWVKQIFNGPEWVLWHWVTVPVPALITFTIYITGGAVYSAMGALDQISQTSK